VSDTVIMMYVKYENKARSSEPENRLCVNVQAAYNKARMIGGRDKS